MALASAASIDRPGAGWRFDELSESFNECHDRASSLVVKSTGEEAYHRIFC